MRVSLRDHLKTVRTALRKNLNKRDKWIKDWCGQLCITSSQVNLQFLKNLCELKFATPLDFWRTNPQTHCTGFQECLPTGAH